jgi:hypothetical protein
MTHELKLENFDLTSIKKLYNEVNDCNTFLNQYTLLDVEESKKKVYIFLVKKYNYQDGNSIQSFVESTATQLISALFLTNDGDSRNTQMVGVKNIIQDPRKLNPTYFQETYRIINVDSMYRKNIWESNMNYDSRTSTDMTVQLNDVLDNVVSLELTNVCIPYTFYTIDETYGNNYFYVQNAVGDLTKIDVSSGNYSSSTLIGAINDSLTSASVTNMSFTLNAISSKVSVTNSSGSDYTLVFYDYLDDAQSFANAKLNSMSPDTQSKINNNLGWILGFRTIDSSNVSLEYDIADGATIQAESLCFIPHTKYFIIVIDDLNKNQTNKGLVQISHSRSFIKNTRYYNNTDNSLNCLSSSNLNTFIDESGRVMTKNQLYSAMQINNHRTNLTQRNSNLNANLINNVFAIVPFENKSLEWGSSIITSDKNKFKRKYSGPVTIGKLQVKLLDDRGNVMNLNGAEWSFSMVSTHLYQS